MTEYNLGPYKIISKLGAGGMATVFKALDPRGRVNRRVAIKVLRPQFAANNQLRNRFMHEVRVAANLEHLHILPVYDYGEQRGVLYIVMRLMEYGSVKELLRQHGIFSPFQAAHIIRQVAQALAYAQSCGVTHRDLKPANILLDGGGNTYLADFGLAKLAEDSMHLTGSAYIGTPAYSSPEQCKGLEVTPATDIYSLGVILFEVLTGRLPFTGSTVPSILHKHIYEPLPNVKRLNPKLSQPVIDVIHRAMAKDPDARYPNMRTFADALDRAVIASPSPSEPLVPDNGKDNDNVDRLSASYDTPLFTLIKRDSPPPGSGFLPDIDTDSKPPDTLRGHTACVNKVMWHPGGQILASASKDRTVRIWDPNNGNALAVLAGHTKWVSTLAWSPNGRVLASGGEDGMVRIWSFIHGTATAGEPYSGKTVATMGGAWGWIWSLAWSPDGTRLAIGSGDDMVRVCHLGGDNKRQVTVLSGHGWDVLAVTWSPQGSKLASASFDETVRIWQIEGAGGQEVLKLDQLRQTTHALAWQPGPGMRLAGGGKDGKIYLWQVTPGPKKDGDNAEGGALTGTLDEHTDTIRALAWDRSGQKLASAGNDGTVRVWDAASGAQLIVFKGHNEEVHTVDWHPSGKMLASGSRDGTIRLWMVP